MQDIRIKTKADAMAFAIEQSGGDLGKADTIFRMFVDNMKLPDTETTSADGCFKKLEEAADALTRRIAKHRSEKFEAQPEAAPCYIGQSEAEPSTPSTIILPGMPDLEWMTENLSGFGGTEIDGNTYYTWEEAMAAAEQLGNGWRLPTQEEFEALVDLGSTWDDDRKGRWFGGNHDADHAGSLFFPATGCRNESAGALHAVGAHGDYYSSSSYATGSINVGYLWFNASNVYPLNNGNRALAVPVRCVRNVK